MLKIYKIVTDVLKYPCPTFISCDYPNRFLAAAAKKSYTGSSHAAWKNKTGLKQVSRRYPSSLKPGVDNLFTQLGQFFTGQKLNKISHLYSWHPNSSAWVSQSLHGHSECPGGPQVGHPCYKPWMVISVWWSISYLLLFVFFCNWFNYKYQPGVPKISVTNYEVL